MRHDLCSRLPNRLIQDTQRTSVNSTLSSIPESPIPPLFIYLTLVSSTPYLVFLLF